MKYIFPKEFQAINFSSCLFGFQRIYFFLNFFVIFYWIEQESGCMVCLFGSEWYKFHSQFRLYLFSSHGLSWLTPSMSTLYERTEQKPNKVFFYCFFLVYWILIDSLFVVHSFRLIRFIFLTHHYSLFLLSIFSTFHCLL